MKIYDKIRHDLHGLFLHSLWLIRLLLSCAIITFLYTNYTRPCKNRYILRLSVFLSSLCSLPASFSAYTTVTVRIWYYEKKQAALCCSYLPTQTGFHICSSKYFDCVRCCSDVVLFLFYCTAKENKDWLCFVCKSCLQITTYCYP